VWHLRTTGNSCMATQTGQTGSTYISESSAGIIKIPTANLGFSTTTISKRVFLGDSNNERQPKMAAETGNTYIFGILSDSAEIPTANPRLSTMASSIKVAKWSFATTRNDNIDVLGANLAILGCRRCLNHLVTPLSSYSRGRKSQICRWNLDAICLCSRDIKFQRQTVNLTFSTTTSSKKVSLSMTATGNGHRNRK